MWHLLNGNDPQQCVPCPRRDRSLSKLLLCMQVTLCAENYRIFFPSLIFILIRHFAKPLDLPKTWMEVKRLTDPGNISKLETLSSPSSIKTNCYIFWLLALCSFTVFCLPSAREQRTISYHVSPCLRRCCLTCDRWVHRKPLRLA